MKKFRRYQPLKVSTEPISGGCNASYHNRALLEEIDALGLSRERALVCDEGGELHKATDWESQILTKEESESIELEYQAFFNVDHSKRLFDNNLPIGTSG